MPARLNTFCLNLIAAHLILFSEVRQKLEDAGIAMASAEVTMIPQTWVELTDGGTVLIVSKRVHNNRCSIRPIPFIGHKLIIHRICISRGFLDPPLNGIVGGQCQKRVYEGKRQRGHAGMRILYV